MSRVKNYIIYILSTTVLQSLAMLMLMPIVAFDWYILYLLQIAGPPYVLGLVGITYMMTQSIWYYQQMAKYQTTADSLSKVKNLRGKTTVEGRKGRDCV